MKNSNPVTRLLRKNISASQIAGFSAANFVGLVIIMTSLQFYRDVSSLFNGNDSSTLSRNYITVSKTIDPFGCSEATINDSEIDSIAAQPWVSDIGRFTPARFNVNASVNFNGSGMSTALFFESVPDRFLDIVPPDWTFSDGDTTIPIIIPKDYLSLYNFGFASTRGLPTISEAMVGMLPLRISVSGNGRQQYFKGRIAGFSSRINTIAVPQSFMDYANPIFGESDNSNTSRLIIETSSPGDPAINAYLENHQLETGREADSSQLQFLLTVLTVTVATIGIVICLLALFVLLLSLHLLLQKNRHMISNLLLLGYTPGDVARHYIKPVVAVNAAILIASALTMIPITGLWAEPLQSMGITPSSLSLTIIVAAIVATAVTFVNISTINRLVKRCF